MKKLLLGFVLVFGFVQVGEAYRRSDFAIYYIRGLNSTEDPTTVALEIHNAYPDIPLVVGKIGDGSPAATQTGMYRQLAQLYADASTHPTLAGKHVIVFGSSQGGMLAQAFVEMYGDRLPFTIDSLMTLASPIGGQFGLPDGWEAYVDLVVWHGDAIVLQQILSFLGIKDYLITLGDRSLTLETAVAESAQTRDILDPLRTEIARLLKEFVRNDWPLVDIVFYNAIGQDLISVAGYWKDPQNQTGYRTFNSFLPYINNEVTHANSERYRANLANLNRIVFIWAGLDGVVKPPCSGGKRFYKPGSRTELEQSFTETDQYKQNLLNLGHMYNNGRLFIEYLPYDGHGCISEQGISTGLYHFNAIVNGAAPNDLFDAVKANNLSAVQSLISATPSLLFAKDGFNCNAIYYAGNKLAIAQYLFAQYLAQGRPLDLESQDILAYNAVGSNSLDVLRWLCENLHYNLDTMRTRLIQLATGQHTDALIPYLQSVQPETLHRAVSQNNLALATAIVTANPMLVRQSDGSGMLPILYAGNKLALAQYLFSVHRSYAPLTLTELGTLLYYAFGSGALDVAQWIIETLYFDPTNIQQSLITIGQPVLITYLRTFMSQGRTSIFTAVQQNNLALVQEIIAKNPANAEEWQAGMLPIFYAGNKLAIAQYLYTVHQQLGRPLSTDAIGTLLFFSFGSGALDVARWIIEELHFNPAPLKNDLLAVANANYQTAMVTYLNSLGV